MYTLEVWSSFISKNLESLKQELLEQKEETLKLLDEATEEYKRASAEGDRSENAAFEEAVKKASMYNITLSVLDTRYKNIESRVHDENYKSIGLVTEYSTVKLRALDNGSEIIIKLYPEGIEDINRNIVSKDSRIGKALWLKGKGERITVDHLVMSTPLHYIIEDIY